MELLITLENNDETWEGRVNADMTVYIVITNKRNPKIVREVHSDFKSTAEAATWLDDQKGRAMTRGFYVRWIPAPPPEPPKIKLNEPITKLMEPKPPAEKPKPKEPQPPRVRKVRI